MIRTQVSLQSKMYEQARAEARRQGVSFAELCRQALALLLRQSDGGEKPWMELAGIFDDDDPNASTSVDEVVYGRDRP